MRDRKRHVKSMDASIICPSPVRQSSYVIWAKNKKLFFFVFIRPADEKTKTVDRERCGMFVCCC